MRTHLLLLSIASLVACGDDSSPSSDAGRDAPADAVMDAGPDVSPDAPRIDAGSCEPDSTLGNFCRTDVDCNDVCFCNGLEQCRAGICVAGTSPCDDGIACTADVCDEASTSCESTPDDTVCGDGNPCTGEEICDPEVGCLDGIPQNCSDSDSCTIDGCDPVEGCTHTLRDVDGDGYADSRCDGGDCDDDPMTGVNVNPGVAEVCDNEIDDDCDGAVDIFDADCTPTNDTCASPFPLGGSGFYGWSTQTLADDYELDCESSSVTGFDATFTFTLTAESDVRIAISGPRDAVVELRGPGGSACTDDGIEPIACDRKTSSSGLAEVEVRRLAAGTYYVIASSPQEALYQLTFDVIPTAPPPDIDSCGSAPTISGGVLASELSVLTDQHARPSCQGGSSDYVEAAYRIDLTEPRDVSIRGTSTSSTGFSRDLAIALVTDCSMVVDSEVACEEGSEPEVNIRPLAAGTYYVLVEPNSTTAVEYELQVDITAPVPRADADSCSTAVDVTDTSVVIDAADLENDGGVGCGGDSPPWREAYFSIDVTTRSTVDIDVDPGVVHLVSLGTACGDASSETLCQSGTPSTSETVVLEPGTYFLTVAVPTSSGTFTVATTVTPE